MSEPIIAELPDGTELEFPAGTDPAVIQRKVKELLGRGSAPPQKEVSSFGPEMARPQARTEQLAPPTPYQKAQADRQRIDELKKERAGIYATRFDGELGDRLGRAAFHKAKRARVLGIQDEITVLERGLPANLAQVGGLVGNVVGGLGGAALGTLASPGVGTAAGGAVGGTAGGALFRKVGALMDASRQQMTPDEQAEYLDREAGISQILWDAGGNIVFMGGGQVLGSVGRNTAFGRAIIKKFGGIIEKAPNAAVRPGRGVFAASDSAADVAARQKAADEAAQALSQGNTAPSAGQLTGAVGIVEGRARSVAPQSFKRANEESAREVERMVDRFASKIGGAQSGASPGERFVEGAQLLEERVKGVAAPVYGALAQLRGGDMKFVDISGTKARARALLDSPPSTLRPEHRRFLNDVLKNDDAVTPAEAHSLQSAWQAAARDLEKAGQPNNALRATYTDLGTQVRAALADGLERATSQIEKQKMMGQAPNVDPRLPEQLRQVRDLYRDMNDKVYSTTGSKALRTEDSQGAEFVGAQIFKRGGTTGPRELNEMIALAKKVDTLAEGSAAQKALLERGEKMGLDLTKGSAADTLREAQRGMRQEFFLENFAGAEALRTLPDKLRQPSWRRTFDAAFPDQADRAVIERIAQAAQIAARNNEAVGQAGLGFVLAGSGGGLGFMLGGPVGAAVGATGMYLTPRFLAHAMTQPAYKVPLGKTSAYLLRTAQGAGGAASVNSAPYIAELIEKAKADGFDLTQPEE